MGENLVNHRLLRYTEHTTIKLSCAINHFNNNSIMNVQQSNLKFTNESSMITCENLINHCLLRYTEYHNSKFISPVNKSHLQLNSNHQSNWKEMQCASQSLSIQNQILINVYVPKKSNHHRRININYNHYSSQSCRKLQSPESMTNSSSQPHKVLLVPSEDRKQSWINLISPEVKKITNLSADILSRGLLT